MDAFVPNIFVKVDFGDGCETSDLQIWIIAISPFLVKVIQTPLFLPFFDTPSILDYIKKNSFSSEKTALKMKFNNWVLEIDFCAT